MYAVLQLDVLGSNNSLVCIFPRVSCRGMVHRAGKAGGAGCGKHSVTSHITENQEAEWQTRAGVNSTLKGLSSCDLRQPAKVVHGRLMALRMVSHLVSPERRAHYTQRPRRHQQTDHHQATTTQPNPVSTPCPSPWNPSEEQAAFSQLRSANFVLMPPVTDQTMNKQICHTFLLLVYLPWHLA